MKGRRDLIKIATLTSKTSKQGRSYFIGTLGVAKILLLMTDKPGEWNLVVGQEKLTEEVSGAVDKSAERV